MYNLPPLPETFRHGVVPVFTPQLPAAPEPDREEMSLNSVDELFEAADLSEEDEWNVKMWLARGRAALDAREADRG